MVIETTNSARGRKKLITKKELLEEMENADVVGFTTQDGYRYNIGTANYWVGGSENGFMCDLLGNVEYSSRESVVNDLFSYMAANCLDIKDID